MNTINTELRSEILAELQTLFNSCQEGIDGSWEPDAAGFEAMKDGLQSVVNKLGGTAMTYTGESGEVATDDEIVFLREDVLTDRDGKKQSIEVDQTGVVLDVDGDTIMAEITDRDTNAGVFVILERKEIDDLFEVVQD